jgi:hypothetical protein
MALMKSFLFTPHVDSFETQKGMVFEPFPGIYPGLTWLRSRRGGVSLSDARDLEWSQALVF